MNSQLKSAAITLGFAALLCAGVAPAATKTAGPGATARALAKAINKDDPQAAAALYADGEVALIDEFAPHAWIGPTAPADWFKAADADNKAGGVTDVALTLGPVARSEVEGDTAYLVYPAKLAFKAHGKAVAETALWTFVMTRTDGGWKIRAWSWGSHKAVPAP